MASHSLYLRSSSWFGAVLAVATGLVIATGGCRKSPPSQAAPPPIHRFDVGELAALGGYLEGLDEGRLSVAPPAGWHVKPRDKHHVVQFVLDRMEQSPFPRITVDVRTADYSMPGDVTEASLRAFFDRIKTSLHENATQTVEGPQPLMLGSVPCVRYVVRMGFLVKKASGSGNRSFRGEREVVEALAQGRIYSVILDTYEGKLEYYRADAYAVVAGLRFHIPESTPDDESNASPAENANQETPDAGSK
ncbi:MAG: hypothetical protein ACYC0X_10775 [Pirellulaceae bacterium]